MKRIFLVIGALVVSVLWVAQAESSEMERRWYSAVFGKSFVTAVRSEEVEATPGWPRSSENPPLSARKALLLANKSVTEMEKLHAPWSDDWSRELEQLILASSNDKWYWVVDYRWYPKNYDLGGAAPQLFLVVLMDGEVVAPEEEKAPTPFPGRNER